MFRSRQRTTHPSPTRTHTHIRTLTYARTRTPSPADLNPSFLPHHIKKLIDLHTTKTFPCYVHKPIYTTPNRRKIPLYIIAPLTHTNKHKHTSISSHKDALLLPFSLPPLTHSCSLFVYPPQTTLSLLTFTDTTFYAPSPPNRHSYSLFPTPHRHA